MRIFLAANAFTTQWRGSHRTGATRKQKREDEERTYRDSNQPGLNGARTPRPLEPIQMEHAAEAAALLHRLGLAEWVSRVSLFPFLFRIAHSPFLSIALAVTLIVSPSTVAAAASFTVYFGGRSPWSESAAWPRASCRSAIGPPPRC